MQHSFIKQIRKHIFLSRLVCVLSFFSGYIQTTKAQDMGATALVSPTSPMCAVANRTVTVTIQNYAATPIVYAINPVSVIVNITGPIVQSFTLTLTSGTLAPGATQNVDVTTTANFSSAGTYTVNANTAVSGDANAANNAMAPATIIVDAIPVVNLGPDVTQCGTVLLNAGNPGSTYVWSGGQTTQTITVSSTPLPAVYTIPFAPVAGIGTPVVLGDDEVSASLPIGFSFNFYSTIYTDFNISSNGFITFDPSAPNGCCSGQFLPNAAAPNNLIALAWEDWNPTSGGTIDYFTAGTAPNRKLVVRYNNVPHFSGGGGPLTSQVILYESTNIIEIHTTSMLTDGGLHTMGLENAMGTNALPVPGRNASGTWSVSSGEGKRFILTPGFISVTLTNANGCTGSDVINVIILPAPTNSITITPPVCGSNNGSVSVTPSGGTSPYTYLWSNGNTTSTVTGLTGQPTDTLFVTITDASGCTLTDTAIVECVTGIAHSSGSLSIRVFPNPSNGQFTIYNIENKICDLNIYDMMGEKVYSDKIEHRTSYVVHYDFADGMYFLRINTDSGSIIRKIAINNQ